MGAARRSRGQADQRGRDRRRTLGASEPVLYAATESRSPEGRGGGGLFASLDGGRTWRSGLASLTAKRQHGGQDTPPRITAVACAREASSVAYAGFRGLRRGPGPAGLFNGIAKTTDSGATWTVVHAESNRPSANLDGSWIEKRALAGGGDIWFDAPYSLGVAPSDPNVCYATDLFRTYRTTDGGRSWDQVTSVRRSDDAWTSRGLDVTTCYGVQFDPFDTKRMFVDYTDIGLFRSEDGGASWIGSTTGVPEAWRNTTYWLAFDPSVRGRMWGGFAGTHDLPRPKMWRTRDPGTFRGGVGVSTDGGRRWTKSNAGMPEAPVTHILLDPTSPVGRRTLYACLFGRGVYKSVDDGRTWVAKNDGIAGTQPFAWRLTRAHDGDAVSRRRTTQRARRDRRRRRALQVARRRLPLGAASLTDGDERPDGAHARPSRRASDVSRGLGHGPEGRGRGRRHLSLARRWSDVAQRLRPVAARVRRNGRPDGSTRALCGDLRFRGLPLRR